MNEIKNKDENLSIKKKNSLESLDGKKNKSNLAEFEKNVKPEVKNNELAKIVENKLEGCKREQEVRKELEKRYPEREGYKVVSERYLLDKNGNIARDPETLKARRIDFVVVKDNKVVDMIEVTSKTAPKIDQSAKELRIRENGGNYIKLGEQLIRIPNYVETRIERRD